MEEVSERRYPTCTEYEMSWWAPRVGKEERRREHLPYRLQCLLQWEKEGRRESKSSIGEWEGRGGKIRGEM